MANDNSLYTSTIAHNRLYGDLAWLWPLMSPPEHYADEAGYWLQALRERLPAGKRRILELGCGGGTSSTI